MNSSPHFFLSSLASRPCYILRRNGRPLAFLSRGRLTFKTEQRPSSVEEEGLCAKFHSTENPFEPDWVHGRVVGSSRFYFGSNCFPLSLSLSISCAPCVKALWPRSEALTTTVCRGIKRRFRREKSERRSRISKLKMDLRARRRIEKDLERSAKGELARHTQKEPCFFYSSLIPAIAEWIEEEGKVERGKVKYGSEFSEEQ